MGIHVKYLPSCMFHFVSLHLFQILFINFEPPALWERIKHSLRLYWCIYNSCICGNTWAYFVSVDRHAIGVERHSEDGNINYL